MYGNKTLPGFAAGITYRDENSIWQGYPESTSFKTVKVTGSDGTKLAVGTILKENISDGTYSVFAKTDIISDVNGLPGVRLGIVADFNAEITTDDNEETTTVSNPSTVLIGISGQVDKSKILIDAEKFADLTEEQQYALNTQLEAWNFQLVDVMQA